MELSTGHSGITSVFSLPNLKLVLIKEKLEITVTSSLCLDLPSQFLGIETIAQLADLVNETHLWIARVGSCCFEVSVTINGNLIQEKDLLEIFSEQIMQCKLWNRLCLRLEHDYHAITQLPGVMSFSIHHPDLASALLPPTSAVTSRFRTVLISINIIEARNEPSIGAPSWRPSKKSKGTTLGKQMAFPATIQGEEIDPALEFVDQVAVERFISSLNFRTWGSSDQPVTKTSTELIRPMAEIFTSLSNTSLLEAIFELLLLPPSKRYKGIQVSGDLSASCLTAIAPGVFHIPYLETLSNRFEYLKVISSSLARMRNAESPVLRQKVRELNQEDPQGQKPNHEWDIIAQTIEKRTWNVLLSHSEIPPLKGRATKVRQGMARTKPKGLVVYEDLNSPLIQKLCENTHGYFEEEYGFNPEMMSIDASIIPNSMRLTLSHSSITPGQKVTTECPVLHPASDDGKVHLPLVAFDECLTESQLPTSNFGLGKLSSGSLSRNNPGFLDITESRAQGHDGDMDSSAAYSPGNFYSFGHWPGVPVLADNSRPSGRRHQ